jgi:hypothetical protein
MSIATTSQLMLPMEIVSTYCETPKELLYTLCGKNTEFINVIKSGTCSYHWALNG